MIGHYSWLHVQLIRMFGKCLYQKLLKRRKILSFLKEHHTFRPFARVSNDRNNRILIRLVPLIDQGT